jgi:hypothetical protein
MHPEETKEGVAATMNRRCATVRNKENLILSKDSLICRAVIITVTYQERN